MVQPVSQSVSQAGKQVGGTQQGCKPHVFERSSIVRTMGDVTASVPAAAAVAVRTASVERITNETKISASLALDVHPTSAPQVISVKTGIGFLDHVSEDMCALVE